MVWHKIIDQIPYWIYGIPLIGFFGQEAIRLLRETWEGVIQVTKDPATGQDQVRPQGADLLAQEIFSMLNDSTPQTNNAPVTINQLQGASGLIVNPGGGSTDPPSFHVTGGDIKMATSGTVTIGNSGSQTSSGANLILQGSTLTIPPLGTLDIPATNYNPLGTALPTLYFPNSSTPIQGQAFIGKVTASLGSGQYTMLLTGVTGSVTAILASYPGSYVLPNNTYCLVASVLSGSTINYYIQPFPLTQAVSGYTSNSGSSGALKSLLTALVAAGIVTDGSTDTPLETVSGDIAQLGSGGAVSNLLIGLANLGIITNSSNATPQSVGGAQQSLASGGGLKNLLTACSNLGIVTDSTTNSPQNITGSRSGNPALANLLTGLANLGIITDSTTA